MVEADFQEMSAGAGTAGDPPKNGNTRPGGPVNTTDASETPMQTVNCEPNANTRNISQSQSVMLSPKDLRRQLAHAVQQHLDDAIAADNARRALEAAKSAAFPTVEQVEAWEYEREEVQ